MQLFMPATKDISSVIVHFSDPQSLLRLSLVNKTAYKLVQIRCLELIKTTEISPGFSFSCILMLRSPLWIYTHLVCPILEAQKNFEALHCEKYTGHFLTDGRLPTGHYINCSPLVAVSSYGCPDLFEGLLRIRFGVGSKEYNQELEYAGNERQIQRLKHRHSSEIATENIFKETVSEYDRLHIIEDRYYSITRMIAKSQKIDVLKKWIELFPNSLYCDYNPLHYYGQIYRDIASYGSCEMMSYLLNFPLEKATLLFGSHQNIGLIHYAASKNSTAMLHLFSESQFSLEGLDKNGMTPFCVACEYSAEDSIRYFLNLGMDRMTIPSDNKGRTTPLTCLLFSEKNLEHPLNASLVVDMILAGEKLTKQALKQVIERLMFKDLLKGSISCPGVRARLSQFLNGLESALSDDSIPQNHAIALQILLTQYLALDRNKYCTKFVDVSHHVTELLHKVDDFLHGHVKKHTL